MKIGMFLEIDDKGATVALALVTCDKKYKTHLLNHRMSM